MSPTLVDLFCGGGGLSSGFRRASFDTICAIDSWQPAVETYRQNLGNHVERAGITEQTSLPNAWVIAGGPPCQGFSSAGRRRDDMDGTPTERRGGAPAGLRRLAPDEPSKAITGGALRDFLHPIENRTLTLRECARIQTFPDEWTF